MNIRTLLAVIFLTAGTYVVAFTTGMAITEVFFMPTAPTDTAAEPGCTLPREEGEPLP